MQQGVYLMKVIKVSDILDHEKDLTLSNGAKHRCFDTMLIDDEVKSFEIDESQVVKKCINCDHFPYHPRDFYSNRASFTTYSHCAWFPPNGYCYKFEPDPEQPGKDWTVDLKEEEDAYK